MTEVLFFEVTPEEKKYFSQALSSLKDRVKLSFYPFVLSPETWKEESEAEVIVIFINSQVNRDLLRFFPNLKAIITRSTGVDHIDITECQKRKIVVQNLGDYSAQSVAEMTVGFILALLSRLKERMQRVEIESSFLFQGLQGEEFQGKTLGVVGTGCIGEKVARIALSLGANVLGFDPFPKKSLERCQNFCYARSLGELYQNSDIITFHVPLTPKTYHLFSSKDLPLLKDGVYIVNTSRGEVVSIEALIEGLRQKKIKGVALDVVEGEAFLKKKNKLSSDLKKLLRFPNVIVTPHTAFYTKEARERQLSYTVENLISYLEGKPQRRVV